MAVCTQVFEGGVTTVNRVFGVGFVCWDMGVGVISCDGRFNLFERRVVDVVVADLQNRCGVTTAHTRSAQNADLFRV